MPQAGTPPRNKLLGALPPEDLDRLRPRLESVPLKLRRVLHYPKLPIEHVYFVETGLISVVAATDQGTQAVEAWLIGREGMAGVPVILGVDTTPHRRMVQAEGLAWRMRSADLRRSMDEITSFRALLLRYVHTVLVQAAQSGACNAQHAIPKRLARWLLMAQDRLDSEDLHLTHDVIAKMLGVRRASVTTALQPLEQAGIITAARGHIRVLNRARLERCSCGCYGSIRAELERLSVKPVSAERGADPGTGGNPMRPRADLAL